ncbi:MAG: TniB family protein [Rhodocyclales bacterium]|nr:TniB family protein [Rhodocyclales bacterium]
MDASHSSVMKAQQLHEKAAWRGRPITARTRYLSRLVVMHPQFSRAVKQIAKGIGQVIRRGKGKAAVVIAPTGAGKTTLVKYCATRWGDRQLPDRVLRRVVSFSVPPRPSPGSMSSALLAALGDPFHDKGRTDEKERRCHQLLRACRTRLILIDNVHDVPERRATKGIREVGNWIRNLDEIPALVICLGAKEGMAVIDANSQLRRRCTCRIDINYFGVSTDEDRKQWCRFMHKLDIALPLADPSNLAGKDIAGQIWMASYGIIDIIIDLLTHAVEYAVKAGREHLVQDDLCSAFQAKFMDASRQINPFSPGTLPRTLDDKGDLFHRWLEDSDALI